MKTGTTEVTNLITAVEEQHSDQAKQPLPTRQEEDNKPKVVAQKVVAPKAVQKIVVPEALPESQPNSRLYDTRYHNGLDQDPSKV